MHSNCPSSTTRCVSVKCSWIARIEFELRELNVTCEISFKLCDLNSSWWIQIQLLVPHIAAHKNGTEKVQMFQCFISVSSYLKSYDAAAWRETSDPQFVPYSLGREDSSLSALMQQHCSPWSTHLKDNANRKGTGEITQAHGCLNMTKITKEAPAPKRINSKNIQYKITEINKQH